MTSVCDSISHHILSRIYDVIQSDVALHLQALEYLLRAFPENLKQLSLILTNIWRFEATYVIGLERDVKTKVKSNMTSECWSPVACWLFLTQLKYLTNIMYSQALAML